MLSERDARNSADLSLYWTSDGFRLDGIPYKGLPIFVRPQTMQIELLPTEYGIYVGVVRGRSRSPQTWKASGYALLSFIRFMEANQFDWRQPTEQVLAHYRTQLEHRKLIRATIARVMNTICDFYQWAHTKGHIVTLPFTYDIVRAWNRGMLSHLERRKVAVRPVIVPSVPRRRRYPRYYNRDEQEQLFAALGERDRIMMEWALYTGAREFEICALTVDHIPSPSVYSSRKMYALKIVGKAAVVADLCVPTWLLDRTYQYIHFFGRAEIVRAAKKRGNSVPGNIFLARWGRALRPNSLYKAFRSALANSGLSGRFHDLRHTFAISTLHKLMQLPRHSGSDGLNALLELKYLMRHGSLSSTQIYLEARNYYLTEIYADLYELPERYLRGA